MHWLLSKAVRSTRRCEKPAIDRENGLTTLPNLRDAQIEELPSRKAVGAPANFREGASQIRVSAERRRTMTATMIGLCLAPLQAHSREHEGSKDGTEVLTRESTPANSDNSPRNKDRSKYICPVIGYRMFGAKLRGIRGEDDDAIRAAHVFANTNGAVVIAEAGIFHPGDPTRVPITTNVDWSALEVVLDDDNRSSEPVFEHIGRIDRLNKETVDQINNSGIEKNARSISLPDGLTGTLFVGTSEVQVNRYTNKENNQPRYTSGRYRVHSGGRISLGTRIRIRPGIVNSLEVVPVQQQLRIRLPNIVVNQHSTESWSKGNAHYFMKVRGAHHVDFDGGSVTIHGKAQRHGSIIHIEKSGLATYKGLLGSGRPAPEKTGSYVIQHKEVAEVIYEDVVLHGGWGATNNNSVEQITARGGAFNRIDVHWYVGDILVDGTRLLDYGIHIAGLCGTCTAINCIQILGAETTPGIVRSRTDFSGTFFPGSRIVVINATVYGSRGKTAKIVELNPDPRLINEPHLPSVEIRNVRFEEVDSEAIIVDLAGRFVRDAPNSIVMPPQILVDGIDCSQSEKCHVRLIAMPTKIGRVRLRGFRSHENYSRHNMVVEARNYRHPNATISPGTSFIAIQVAPEDMGIHWSDNRALAVKIIVKDCDNVSIDLALRETEIRVDSSTIVHYKTLPDRSLDPTFNQTLLANGCRIEPLGTAGSDGGRPMFDGNNSMFINCEFLGSSTASGTRALVDLGGASGYLNRGEELAYINVPPKFFLGR